MNGDHSATNPGGTGSHGDATGRRCWLYDPHFLLAALAAVPVWIALGLLVADRMHASLTPMALVSFLALQPVIEELVFRGALQSYLLDRGWTRHIALISTANITTSAAFVSVHLLVQPLGWAVAVAAPSLVFGHLRERFSSVLPAIAMHSIYNAGFALVVWIVRV